LRPEVLEVIEDLKAVSKTFGRLRAQGTEGPRAQDQGPASLKPLWRPSFKEFF
jgi:hypothetical protein